MESNMTTKRIHAAALMHAEECREGKISRREFLTRATALGVATSAAYALIGASAPVQASSRAKMGGTLRIQMEVRALKEPRAYDWSQIANYTRGTLEYLVEYNNDGSIKPMLLEGWEANDDATQFTLHVRPGVKWNNGEDFTAEDVARNINGWADRSAEGNSMAGHFGVLIDPATGKAIEGSIKVLDNLTVRLNLPNPDITVIPGMADYPAAITHSSFNADDVMNAVGTGPYLMTELDVGVKGAITRNEGHQWWGEAVFGKPALDRIEFVDFGTDPAEWLAALEADEVDILYESVGDYIDILDDLGFERSEVVTAATIVIRPNQLAEVDGQKPYADVRVRRALQLAVDNALCLELGYGNRGVPAENHHVAPMHPEYADLPPIKRDVGQARALMEDARMMDYEHELVSIDDDWRKNTTNAVAAQLRDAGFKVSRTIVPTATYWPNWNKYPFSSTSWNHRPLGVQVLALAYRSGEAWNEFGWANPEFDALVTEAQAVADADRRRVIMAKIQRLMQDEGVTVLPFWRSLFRHGKPGLVGTDMHIASEIHHYKLGFAA